ncbi:MAG: hypothetical protein GY913_31410 [Proteobacteria bacterium]|nr:hypothetical protein [Pseudomonadota bacterium]MCP4921428.1 hypothetical protein [Pseudomonadota bacterium]
MTLAVALLACGQDIGVTQNAICDGSKQPSEDYVDEPFDKDGDGYMDGNNPDCVLTYGEGLDCDDGNADVNPSMTELECNGWDDDCDDTTLDAEDLDEDGFSACDDDCDDLNPDVYPAAGEEECNGIDDDCNDETLDAPDVDEDGYTVCDNDCDDLDYNVNPGADEETCNDVDDDCSTATPDEQDSDGDTWSTCDGDCNDDEATAFPGYEEVCDDGIDNDCDGSVDEDCELDYSDTWFLDDSITMSCAWGSVELSFATVTLTHAEPNLAIYGGGTKGQPGTTTGTIEADQSFETERAVLGDCDERYIFEGQFDNANQFTGTFTAKFKSNGGLGCLDCSTTRWDIVGTR